MHRIYYTVCDFTKRQRAEVLTSLELRIMLHFAQSNATTIFKLLWNMKIG